MPTHRERHARRAEERAIAERDGAHDAAQAMRLDKWLWAARFFKTRALAQQAVESGKVKRDGERCKPAHTVRPGDHYAVVRDNLTWNLDVIALADQRGSATDAARLYTEDPASIAARTQMIMQRKIATLNQPQHKGRPTKRQRRSIEEFLADS